MSQTTELERSHQIEKCRELTTNLRILAGGYKVMLIDEDSLHKEPPEIIYVKIKDSGKHTDIKYRGAFVMNPPDIGGLQLIFREEIPEKICLRDMQPKSISEYVSIPSLIYLMKGETSEVALANHVNKLHAIEFIHKLDISDQPGKHKAKCSLLGHVLYIDRRYDRAAKYIITREGIHSAPINRRAGIPYYNYLRMAQGGRVFKDTLKNKTI